MMKDGEKRAAEGEERRGKGKISAQNGIGRYLIRYAMFETRSNHSLRDDANKP